MCQEVEIIIEFYPDVYFLLNCGMNLVALTFVVAFSRVKIKGRRLLAVAALAAGIETMGIIILHPFKIYEVITHLVVSPFLVWFGLKPADKSKMLSYTIYLYLSFFVLGGMMNWMEQNMQMVVFVLPLAYLAIRRVSRHFSQGEQVIWVCLKLKHHEVKVKAYCDTGNTLREPFFQRPVHIVGEQVVRNMLKDYERPLQQIPYRTVAGTGLLRTMVLDSMTLQTMGGSVVIGEPVLGIAEEMRFPNQCEMLLNPSVINKRT